MNPDAPYAPPQVDCRPHGAPPANARELRELRALHADSIRIDGLSLLWMTVGIGPLLILFAVYVSIVHPDSPRDDNARFLTDPRLSWMWLYLLSLVASTIFCVTCWWVCVARPGWAAWPFFVGGCGLFPEFSMFCSDWPKFRELFGDGRTTHGRVLTEYQDQERQIGELTERDLERLRFRPGSGWDWDERK